MSEPVLGRCDSIPRSEWMWLAYPAHFIGAIYCRFRLATVVGDYIVSSVGCMMTRESSTEPQKIGCDRTHETMVFLKGPVCTCGCGEPRIASGCEIETLGANSDAECRANHMAACEKYAALRKAVPQ